MMPYKSAAWLQQGNKSFPYIAFTPLALSPAIWFRGAVGTYQDTGFTTPATTNGAIVEGWQDQSGNANNATQATSANAAGLATGASGINGASVLTFNSTSAYLQLANLVNCTGPFTLWAVGKRTTSTIWTPLNSTSSANGEACNVYSDNNVYVAVTPTTYVSTAYTGSNGVIAIRVRRNTSNVVFVEATGMAEVSAGTLTGTVTVNCLAARPGQPFWNGSGNLHAELLLNNTTDLVTSSPALVTAYESLLNSEYGVSP
jgi:hypothetical protein